MNSFGLPNGFPKRITNNRWIFLNVTQTTTTLIPVWNHQNSFEKRSRSQHYPTCEPILRPWTHLFFENNQLSRWGQKSKNIFLKLHFTFLYILYIDAKRFPNDSFGSYTESNNHPKNRRRQKSEDELVEVRLLEHVPKVASNLVHAIRGGHKSRKSIKSKTGVLLRGGLFFNKGKHFMDKITICINKVIFYRRAESIFVLYNVLSDFSGV